MKNTSPQCPCKIPAGVETGQQIRLAGPREAGFNGGSYGTTCMLLLMLRNDDKFEREGTTIFYS